MGNSPRGSPTKSPEKSTQETSTVNLPILPVIVGGVATATSPSISICSFFETIPEEEWNSPEVQEKLRVYEEMESTWRDLSNVQMDDETKEEMARFLKYLDEKELVKRREKGTSKNSN
jgi:hypothetical protein